MYSFYQSGYLETFKQVINKLSKNRSSPLPLVFANVDAMELISKNKNLLRGVFKVFDTRNFGRYFKKYEGQMQLNYTHRVQLYQRVPMRHTLKLQLTFLDLKMLEESIETSFSSSLMLISGLCPKLLQLKVTKLLKLILDLTSRISTSF